MQFFDTGLVVDRLGHDELGAGCALLLQAAHFVVKPVGLGAGIEHHAGVRAGRPGHAHLS